MSVADILWSWQSNFYHLPGTLKKTIVLKRVKWFSFTAYSSFKHMHFITVSLPQQDQHVCEAAEQVFGGTTGKPPLWSAEAFGWDQRHQSAGGACAQEHHEILLLFHHNTATKAAVWRRKCKLSYILPHLRHPLRLCDMSLLHSWDAWLSSMSSEGNSDLRVCLCLCGCS